MGKEYIVHENLLKKLAYFEAKMSWNENQQDNQVGEMSFELPEEIGFSTFEMILFYLYNNRFPEWNRDQYQQHADSILQEMIHLYILVDMCLAIDLLEDDLLHQIHLVLVEYASEESMKRLDNLRKTFQKSSVLMQWVYLKMK